MAWLNVTEQRTNYILWAYTCRPLWTRGSR